MPHALEVLVNGDPRGVPEGSTLSDLLHQLGMNGHRVAVAVNREVVPRSAFPGRRLVSGDRVEILEAVGGG